MCKDYFNRLTIVEYTAWDLNCRTIVPHTKNRNKTERKIRKAARRKDKIFLKIGVDITAPVC